MTPAQLSQPAFDLVARRYDLGHIISCSQVTSDPLTCAYKLETDRGNVCLKRHRQNKTALRLDLEEKLIIRLGMAGFNLAPHLVLTSDDKGHMIVDDDRWSVYEFVDSQPAFDWKDPQWTETHCLNAGSALAEFHYFGQSCLALFEADGINAELCQPAHLVLPAYLRTGLEEARIMAESIPDHPSLRPESLLAGAEAIARELNLLARSNAPYLIHGDYHPGNLLFDGDRAVCLLDYEEARPGAPSFDLGYAAVFFCMQWGDTSDGTTKEGSDGLIHEASFSALLDGYYRRASRLDLPPSVLEYLSSQRTAFAALKSDMKLSCYLAIGWLLSRLALEKAELRPLLSRALLHFARALETLDHS